MSRKLIIAANWKMNKGPAETEAFLEEFLAAAADLTDLADLIIAPNSLSIPTASELINDINPAVGLAAQTVSESDNGAFTGETSTDMLKELFVNYVIIGHSERRSIFGETNAQINAKLKKALSADITPLFCIGETLAEREGGQLETVLGSQIKEGLEGISDISNVVIAYEPVWAIGTGVTATAQQAQDTHKFCRSVIEELYGAAAAAAVRIQYGGSVKGANSAELLGQPDIDGALVGGAALEAASFLELIRNAVA
ncbi:MAG: triose-phosphate isomerase [Rubritalea sp.]|jgi:triosephosphate isomerase|tara:strand:+ start:230 stop:994 length:765 start_codon:yes stop_codon:yes gene_type:complete